MDYEANEIVFNNYVDECRKLIERCSQLSDDDHANVSRQRQELFEDEKRTGNKTISISSSDLDIVKAYRKRMIRTKVDHTARIVYSVARMADSMKTPTNFKQTVMVAALLHDIGRFNQATWSNIYNDKEDFKHLGGINHAIYGAQILTGDVGDRARIYDYAISDNLKLPILVPVLYHGTDLSKLPVDLRKTIYNLDVLDVDNKFMDTREITFDAISVFNSMNESEKIIVSALVQMVRDVDKLDILYQRAIGEYPVVRNPIWYKTEGKKLREISKYWGISEEEILQANDNTILDEKGNIKRQILIPINNVEPHKLAVPEEVKMRYFNGESISLNELSDLPNHNFIGAIWWQIFTFLKDINFTSTLEVVYSDNLLDKIYAQYPEKYKPLVKEVFDYAKERLLKERIEVAKNEGSIYVQNVNLRKK